MTHRSAVLAGLAAAATILAGVVAPAAHAEDADPFGPELAAPFTTSNIGGGGTTGGPGTDALNAAVAARCHAGTPYAEPQWFRLAKGAGGDLRLVARRLHTVGAGGFLASSVGAAVVDLDTGTVLGCDGPTAVDGTGNLAVVAYSDPDDLTACRDLGTCSMFALQLFATLAAAPDNDDWHHARPIASLPWEDVADSTIAGDDGDPDVLQPCPLSDSWQVEQRAGVWWRYTPTDSGDLLISDPPPGFVYGVAAITDDGPVGLDWMSDPDLLCDFEASPHVTAGVTYLIGIVRRLNIVEEPPPFVFGAPVRLAVHGLIPSPVRQVFAVPGDSQATVGWTPADNAGSSRLTGYRIDALDDNDSVVRSVDVPVGTSGVVTGLTNDTAYRFRVTALRGDVVGKPSQATDIVVPREGATQPREPGAPVVDSVTLDALRPVLTWTTPSDPGTSAVTGYRIRSYDEHGTLTGTAVVAAGTDRWVGQKMRIGTRVAFDVAAENAVGIGEPSARTDLTTIVAAPARVTGLQAHVEAATMQVTWNALAVDARRPVDHYRLLVTDATDPSQGRTVAEVTGTSHELAVRPWHTYRLLVVGVGPGGSSPDARLTVTAAAAGPSAPRDVKVAAGDHAADLSWLAPEYGDVDAYRITGYRDDRGSDGPDLSVSVDPDDLVTSGGRLHHVLADLAPGVGYRFSVTAIAAGVAGVRAGPTRAVVPFTEPGAPRITGARADGDVVTVTWQPPKDNGGSRVSGYVVTLLRLDDSGDVVATLPQAALDSASRRLAVTVTQGGRYVAVVAAVNAAGQGAASARSKVVVAGASGAWSRSGHQ